MKKTSLPRSLWCLSAIWTMYPKMASWYIRGLGSNHVTRTADAFKAFARTDLGGPGTAPQKEQGQTNDKQKFICYIILFSFFHINSILRYCRCERQKKKKFWCFGKNGGNIFKLFYCRSHLHHRNISLFSPDILQCGCNSG